MWKILIRDLIRISQFRVWWQLANEWMMIFRSSCWGVRAHLEIFSLLSAPLFRVWVSCHSRATRAILLLVVAIVMIVVVGLGVVSFLAWSCNGFVILELWRQARVVAREVIPSRLLILAWWLVRVTLLHFDEFLLEQIGVIAELFITFWLIFTLVMLSQVVRIGIVLLILVVSIGLLVVRVVILIVEWSLTATAVVFVAPNFALSSPLLVFFGLLAEGCSCRWLGFEGDNLARCLLLILAVGGTATFLRIRASLWCHTCERIEFVGLWFTRIILRNRIIVFLNHCSIGALNTLLYVFAQFT